MPTHSARHEPIARSCDGSLPDPAPTSTTREPCSNLWTNSSRQAATRLVARAQAVEAGIRATNTAEARQNAWYNLSILLAVGNDAAGMERSLRNAIAWSPNWFKPHWALAQLLEMTGRHAEALAEARAAVDLDGGHDAEVTETWKRLRSRDRPQTTPH